MKSRNEQILDDLMQQAAALCIPSGVTPDEFFTWPLDACPACMKEPDEISTVSAWYYDEKNAVIVYWLCRSCVMKMTTTSQKWVGKINALIEKNTIREFSNAKAP